MSSFNLKQQEIAGEEVHRNILPSSHYKHGILYHRIGVSAEVKNADPVA
jgi:hypothetical protein